MKKLILVLAFLVGFGGSAFASYDEGAEINKKLSSGGPASSPVRIYTLVRYPECAANSVGVSAGDVVVWDIVSDDGVTINLVGASQTGSLDTVAGVIVGTIPTADSTTAKTAVADLGRRNWGYLQVYGLNSATKVDGTTIAAGQAVSASATARRASNASNPAANRVLGFAYDASSASGEAAEIFINNQ